MTLQVTRADGVWEVRLDRPASANALSTALVDALHDVLDQVEQGGIGGPTVLVLRGNERHFAAGFDLSGLEGETDATLALRFLRIGTLLERLSSLPCVTVAVVEGAAIGAGADLAVACDHRLALASATVRFPGAGFGVVLGTRRLADVVGTAGAQRLSSGLPVAAADLPGLFTAVHVDPADLGPAVAGLVDRWSRLDPATRAALLVESRTAPAEAGAALAALARSVSTPGLHGRLSAYASRHLEESVR